MFNAVEVMNVTLLNDAEAKPYDYVKKGTTERKQGVAVALSCLVEDEKTGRLNFLIVNIGGLEPSVSFKKGDYILTAPATYFKKTFVSGVNVHQVNFSASRTECSFVKSKK